MFFLYLVRDDICENGDINRKDGGGAESRQNGVMKTDRQKSDFTLMISDGLLEKITNA